MKILNLSIKDLEPSEIIDQCISLSREEIQVKDLAVLDEIGNPNHTMFVYADDGIVKRDSSIVLPLYSPRLQLIQCLKLSVEGGVEYSSSDVMEGFAYYGELSKNLPIIISFDIETFFSIARTGYTVILFGINNTLQQSTSYKKYQTERLKSLIEELEYIGYKQLFLPIRPEHQKHFVRLQTDTNVKLLPLYKIKPDCDLTQYDEVEVVEAFLKNAIENVSDQVFLDDSSLDKKIKFNNGYFEIQRDGIYFSESDKDRKIKSTRISSLVTVIAKTRDIFSKNWGILLSWTDPNGITHEKAIPSEHFQTDGAELRRYLAYHGVWIASDKKSRELFLSYLTQHPREDKALCVNRVGWTDECYVLPHKTFGKSEDLIVYQSDIDMENQFKMKGALELWKDKLGKSIESHDYLVFSVCAALSGQLINPLGLQGCGFHFKGASSKGKTTALNLACSMWGHPKDFNRSWKATGNALEHTAYMHNDGFLALDEIGEIANPRELGDIIYMLANGVGKGRMTKKISPRTAHRWNLVFLSSGEKSVKEIMNENG